MSSHTFQHDPASRVFGAALVALGHCAIIYVLFVLLAQQLIEIRKPGVVVMLIEEVRTPPPEAALPKIVPRLQTPSPPYIPPPEVAITAPPSVDTITGSNILAATPAPAPAPKAVVAAPVQAAANDDILGNCSNARQIGAQMQYPSRARYLGLTSGSAEVTFTVTGAGEVAIDGVSSTHAAFSEAAIAAVKQLQCRAGRYVWPVRFALAAPAR